MLCWGFHDTDMVTDESTVVLIFIIWMANNGRLSVFAMILLLLDLQSLSALSLQADVVYKDTNAQRNRFFVFSEPPN